MITHCKFKKLIPNKKAQALIELAIFGSVLLFCFGILIRYGLMMNYQPRVQMETFRRTLKGASIGSGIDSYQQAIYAVVKDKGNTDPQILFALGERTPAMDVENLVMTNHMFRISEGDPTETPRVFYNINGRRFVFTTAEKREYEPDPSLDGDAGNPEPEGHLPGEIWIKVQKTKEEIAQDPQGKPIKWVKVPVENSWGKLNPVPDNGSEYTWEEAYDNKAIRKADVDGDGKEEEILYVVGTGTPLGMSLTLISPTIKKFVVWDYQEGDIDATVENPALAQGLQATYGKEIVNKSSFVKENQPSHSLDRRRPHYRETVIRNIKVNPNKYKAGDEIKMDLNNDGNPDNDGVEPLEVQAEIDPTTGEKYVYVEVKNEFKKTKNTNWFNPKPQE